jgi:hypothetical protein
VIKESLFTLSRSISSKKSQKIFGVQTMPGRILCQS